VLVLPASAIGQTMDDVESALRAGDVAAAVATFEAVRDADAADVDAWEAWASMLYRAGEEALAIEALEGARRIHPSTARFAFMLGVIHRNAERWDDAVGSFEDQTRLAPDDTTAWAALAQAREAAGDTGGAVEAWDEVEARADDDDVRARAIAARARLVGPLTVAGESPSATQATVVSGTGAFDGAGAVPPIPRSDDARADLLAAWSDADAAEAAGAAAAARGQWRDAIDAWASACLHDAGRAGAWYRLGSAHAIAGDAAAAASAFARARELDPAIAGIDARVEAAIARAAWDAERGIDRPGYFADPAIREAARADAFDTGRWLLGVRAELDPEAMTDPLVDAERAALEGDLDAHVDASLEAVAARPADLPRYLGAARALLLAGDVDAATWYVQLFVDLGGSRVDAGPVRAEIDRVRAATAAATSRGDG
jgi:tetratricopeptide (TPR) repeat protein